MRSLNGLKCQVSLVPVNKEFYFSTNADYDNEAVKRLRKTVEVDIDAGQQFTVVIKTVGGIDHKFFDSFDFGSWGTNCFNLTLSFQYQKLIFIYFSLFYFLQKKVILKKLNVLTWKGKYFFKFVQAIMKQTFNKNDLFYSKFFMNLENVSASYFRILTINKAWINLLKNRVVFI